MTILDQFKLEGKTALVTGCRRGIGRGFAQALAEAGADIVGVSASLEPEGSDVDRDVVAAGRRFWSYACDFSSRAALYGFIARAKEEVPPIDILVNNAGTNIRMPAVEYQDEAWDEVLEVNLNAQFILAREFGKEMVARGAGKIIFTASLMTFQGGITIPAYAASKGGIGQLTKALSNEWAAKGVNVNAITPGYIATDLTEPLRTDPTRGPEIMARIPAGRWGTPDDMKGAVLFLASDAAAYVHGTVLVVDGGWLAR
jgi:2-dehydro-3-deoxy-D-gluconate 5-dehydrogenase